MPLPYIELQRKRSEEARHLISQRPTNEARSVFERNSSMGQMNFRKPSLPNAASSSVPSSQISDSQVQPNTSASTLHASAQPPTKASATVNTEKRLPEKKRDLPNTNKQPSNNISISHSNNGANNAIQEDVSKHQVNKLETNVNNRDEKSIRSKEVEEQANMANANEVNTEDIVVPPPESFGNDDNHRALAAAALQVLPILPTF